MPIIDKVPASYLIVDGVVVIALTGYVYDREVMSAQADLFKDPNFIGAMPRLVDATQAREMILSARIIRQVAQAAYNRGLRRAALVGNKTHIIGLMRMYSEYVEYAGDQRDALVEVFGDTKAAIAWLNGRRMAVKPATAD